MLLERPYALCNLFKSRSDSIRPRRASSCTLGAPALQRSLLKVPASLLDDAH